MDTAHTWEMEGRAKCVFTRLKIPFSLPRPNRVCQREKEEDTIVKQAAAEHENRLLSFCLQVLLWNT